MYVLEQGWFTNRLLHSTRLNNTGECDCIPVSWYIKMEIQVTNDDDVLVCSCILTEKSWSLTLLKYSSF